MSGRQADGLIAAKVISDHFLFVQYRTGIPIRDCDRDSRTCKMQIHGIALTFLGTFDSFIIISIVDNDTSPHSQHHTIQVKSALKLPTYPLSCALSISNEESMKQSCQQ